MKTNKTTIGKVLEDEACLYLTRSDYNIIERNFRLPFGEIDIVAKDKGTKELVFVEVKGMTIKVQADENNRAKPEDHFNTSKIQKLKKIIMAYLGQKDISGNKYFDSPWRVDLIAIEVSTNGVIHKLNHYKNIYMPFE
jgi:putative endonuclease